MQAKQLAVAQAMAFPLACAAQADSQGHPQTFATRLLSQGVAGDAGTPVTGAEAGLNRAHQSWWVLGSGTLLPGLDLSASPTWNFHPYPQRTYVLELKAEL